MELSMQTALLIYSVICMVGFITIHFLNWKTPREKYIIVYFLLFYILSSIGTTLIIFRDNLDYIFSILVANSLLVVGSISLAFGARRIICKRSRYIAATILYIVFLSLMSYFTFIDLNVYARILVYDITLMIIYSNILISLQKHKEKISIKDELLSPVILLIIVILFLRLLAVFVFDNNSNDFLALSLDPFFVVMLGVSNILIIAGLLSVYNKESSVSLNESERSKTSLLSNLPGFAYRCKNDEFWTMLFVSPGFKDLTGWEDEDILNNKRISFEEIILEPYRAILRDEWKKAIEEKRKFVYEYEITRKNGQIIWVWEQGIPLMEYGECTYIEGFIEDITERKTLENSLEFISYRDALTGLHNRRYMDIQVKKLSILPERPLSVIMGDVNGLKFINDSFGHAQGDRILIIIAKLFKKVIGNDEYIFRLGGDEYLIILPNTDKQECERIMEQIHEEISRQIYQNIGMSASLGSATSTSVVDSMREILEIAENNMYKQKIYTQPSSRRKAVDAVLKTLFEKDELSEKHSRNVSEFSRKLAEKAGLSKNKIARVETAGLLHDVGKIIISHETLTSTKKLTIAQWKEIKMHPEIGFRILSSVSDLKDIANIILRHHERIDGTGYPNGVQGDDIPIESRIISICDAYEAMTNKRFYKKALSKKEAIQELIDNEGTQFDERLVGLFIEIVDEL